MKDNKSLTTKLFFKGIILNVSIGIIILFYSIFIANIKIRMHYWYVILTIFLILFAEFCVSPFTNIIITARTSRKIREWKTKGYDKEQRTKLFLMIHRIPVYKQIECFLYFVACSFILFSLLYFGMHANLAISCATLMSFLLGSYISGLVTLSFSRKVCTDYEKELVNEGIDEKILDRKKVFGLSYKTNFTTFCIIPVIWSILMFVGVFFVYYYNNVETTTGVGYTNENMMQFGITKGQLSRMAFILIFNIMMCILSVYSFLSAILVSSSQLQQSMTHIIKNDIFTVNLLPTDFDNEVSYNMHLVNKVVLLFRKIFDEISGIGKTMIDPINSITEISQATATTSLEQSTGVKEILATMEETDAQTRSIVDKISDVTEIAENTAKNVQSGFETLQSNLDKMNDITQANVTTIAGIRELGEKIGSIWEIVKIINDIADQTRIIAFNAELEASSAGDLGKNFHIVANEVRRLAAGITNSVEQIKERITEIQHSSDNLIITSESGTEKIREGLELSEKLKEKFSDIQSSSEVTVESALQIKKIIYQQSAAFDQIVTTVRQISAGIENFSSSTGTMNETAKKLQSAANNLENLHKLIVQ